MNYKFCPKCGGSLKSKKLDHTLHPVCADCDFVFYQNSKPTASAVIVNNQNEVLLIKRAINPYHGKWDLPGGFLENGEGPVEGLQREMSEELSVEIEPVEILTIVVDKYEYVKGNFYTLNLFYRCKIKSGEIKLDSENSDYGWFSEEAVPWKELAFKNTTHALKELYK